MIYRTCNSASIACLLIACNQESAAQVHTPRHLVIHAGVGTNCCRIGDSVEAVTASLGEATSVIDEYVEFENDGVGLLTEGDRVVAIFFYFRSERFQPYSGKTKEGIGAGSKEIDVVDAYGDPDRVSRSVVSRFGVNPGAKEVSINYESRGIIFTFYDGELADIRVLAESNR